MDSPATARNGDLLSAGRMAIAIGATAVLLLLEPESAGTDASEVSAGLQRRRLAGDPRRHRTRRRLGLYTARTVKMTAMPQLVSLFNAVGGGAAALIAIDEYLKFAGANVVPGLTENVATVLDIVDRLDHLHRLRLSRPASYMGLAITPSRPVRVPGGQVVTLALALITIAGALFLWTGAT